MLLARLSLALLLEDDLAKPYCGIIPSPEKTPSDINQPWVSAYMLARNHTPDTGEELQELNLLWW